MPDGEPGRLVITNLVNRGSVLLNYPIGDLGSVGPADCACGRTFRMLSELEGRVEDMLALPDGRVRAPARGLAGVQGRRGGAAVPAGAARAAAASS